MRVHQEQPSSSQPSIHASSTNNWLRLSWLKWLICYYCYYRSVLFLLDDHWPMAHHYHRQLPHNNENYSHHQENNNDNNDNNSITLPTSHDILTCATQNSLRGFRQPRYEFGNMIIRAGIWNPALIRDLAQQQSKIRTFGLQSSLGARYLAQEVSAAHSFAHPTSLHNMTMLNHIIMSPAKTSTSISTNNNNEDKLPPVITKSRPSDIVIHLRLGDNMQQESFYKENDFNEGHQTPHTHVFFQRFLKSLLISQQQQQQQQQRSILSSFFSKPFQAAQPPTKRKIILMGNFCSGAWAKTPQTMHYSQKYVVDLSAVIAQFLKQHDQAKNFEIVHHLTRSGANTTKDLVHQVDSDVAYTVATAGTFVCSGGSFSHILAALVLENGGQVYGCQTDGRYQNMFAKYNDTNAIQMVVLASSKG